MTQDLWAVEIENEARRIFRELVDDVGFDKANFMFDRAGLNDDRSWNGKEELAQNVADRTRRIFENA